MIKENIMLDLSNEEYHTDNGYYSSSQLKDAAKSRMSFYQKYIAKTIPRKHIPAFDLGTAAHTLLFEPHLYDDEITSFNGVRKGAKFEAFRMENKGKIILSKLEEARVRNWIKAVKNNQLAKPYVEKGIAEKSIFTTINGLQVKARFDYLLEDKGLISDLKTTTGELNPASISKKVYAFGYHISAALYLDCFNKALNNKIKEFYLIFVSKDTLQVKVVLLDETIIEEGRKQYLKAIEEIKTITSPGFVCKEEVIILKSQETLPDW